jgi:hypothetical protein
MIIVTGTKRSGTSLWMQILIAAGLRPFGEAFPGQWAKTLKEANPEGFFESNLRHGIYFGTNPDPRTGHYVFPEQVEHHAVKVFIPGLVRTDRAYIGKVVATLRSVREYVPSIQRLWSMEGESAQERVRPDPLLEWWSENYALLKDIALRRYPVHVETFGRLHQDPERVVTETLAWLGRGDPRDAIALVQAKHRHFDGEPAPLGLDVEPRLLTLFDDLYDTIHERRELTPDFVQRLNDAHIELKPRLDAEHERIRRALHPG